VLFRSDPSTMVTGYVETFVEYLAPYAVGDLPLLNYTQSGDTVYFSHPSYPPYKLCRMSAYDWDWVLYDTGSTLVAPAITAAYLPAVGSTTSSFKYTVSALDLNGRESDPATEVTLVVNRPWDVGGQATLRWNNLPGSGNEWSQVGLGASNEWYLRKTGGGAPLLVTSEPAAVFALTTEFVKGTVGALPGANTWGWGVPPATSYSTIFVRMWSGIDPTPFPLNYRPGTVSSYIVYKNMSGQWGYAGEAMGGYFTDDNILPDYLFAMQENQVLFAAEGDYPASMALFQQRLFAAGTNNAPLTLWGGQSGDYENFALSTPQRDTDALEATLASGSVDPIRHVVPMSDSLYVLTLGSEWKMTGGNQAALTPFSLSFSQLGAHGSAAAPAPIVCEIGRAHV